MARRTAAQQYADRAVVAYRLRCARQDAGLTQAQAAARIKRAQSYISDLETAQRRLELGDIWVLVAAYECDLESIVKIERDQYDDSTYRAALAGWAPAQRPRAKGRSR